MKVCLILCVLVAVASAYQSGAPQGACGDMTPQHGKPAQTTPSPYIIKLSNTSVRPNGKVYVTLEAPKGDSFKGFFIQGRVGDQPWGKFEKADGVTLVNCGSGVNTGATHANGEPKEAVTVAWVAPPDLTENVVFYVTTARDGYTFWVQQKSETLTVRT